MKTPKLKWGDLGYRDISDALCPPGQKFDSAQPAGHNRPQEGGSGKRKAAETAGAVPENDIPRHNVETVLVVEDEAVLLDVNTTMLRDLGYKVLPAGTPTEAIRLADEHVGRIDLLMTDVVMPEMNGRQLEQQIRKSNPGIGCLFMSGYTASVISHHGVLDEGV